MAKAFYRLILWNFKKKTSTIFYSTAKYFIGYLKFQEMKH